LIEIEKKINEIGKKQMAEWAEEAKKSNKEFEPMPDLTYRDLVLLILSDISDDRWHVYAHKNADLILLIPKNYLKRRVDISIEDINDQIKECGFSLDNLDKIEELAPEKLLEYLQNRQISTSANLMDALESMFIAKKNSKNSTSGTWNIFVDGHGGPGRKKKDLDQSKIWEHHIEEWTQFTPPNKESALNKEQQLKYFNEKLESAKQEYLQFLKKYPGLKDLSENAIVPNTAQVAGLGFDDFARLLKFFDQGINTSFVHYSTCFGGGYNQAFINEVLKKLNVNFLVSSEGVGELYTRVAPPKRALKFSETNDALTFSPMRFYNFFSMLNDYFGQLQPTEFKKSILYTKTKALPSKDPLGAIIKNVVAQEIRDNNQPFVRIPHVGVFGALTVDKKFKILTNSIVKAHELEKRTIDLSNGELEAALIYPDYIGVPVKMGKGVALISPTPTKLVQPNRVLHIFEEILFEETFAPFLFNLLRFNSSPSKILFLVKKLLSGPENKKLIENVVMLISGQGPSANVDVVFMLNKVTYKFSLQIKGFNEEEDKDDLLKQCNEFKNKLSIASPEDIKQIASKVFEPNELREMKESIDLSTLAQNIGMLKKIIMKQIIKQKAWGKNKKKVHKIIEKVIQKKADEAKRLKKDNLEVSSIL
jgi:hypothetical protein